MREIRALTGLRGVAASVVALTHFDFVWAPAFGRLGLHNVMVDIFFCLSGFTLASVYSTRKDTSFRSFMMLRIARIYPLYLLSLLVLSVTLFSAQAQSLTDDFIRQVLMINSWPWIGSGVNWNNPAWSVSVEFLAYILLFRLLLARIRAPSPMVTLGIVIFSVWMIGRCLDQFDWTISYNGKAEFFEVKYLVEAGRALLGFGVGYLMAIHTRENTSLAQKIYLSADTLSVLLLICVYIRYSYGSSAVWMLYIVPLWITSLLNETSITSRILSSPFFYFMGTISYSLYLLHGVVRMLIENYTGIDTHHGAASVALLLATLFTATVVYFAYELPSRKFLRRLSKSSVSLLNGPLSSAPR